jgi:pimeloyl-ACP methyl ester carboxylesterase
MRALVETVEIDGAVVRLRTMAPAGRSRDTLTPTVVLVHGIGMSHRSFTRLQRVLSRTYRTVAVDLPGFGGLPPVGAVGIDGFARTVLAALREVEITECVALGQSMGAQVAVEMARQDPGFVTSVVLVGPVIDDHRPRLWQQALTLLGDGPGEGIRMNWVLLSDYARSIPQYLAILPAMMRYPMFRVVAGLTVPVLVIRGGYDPIADHDWGRRLAGVAGEGALIELPGPHHVQEHQPAPVAAIVDEFLRVQSVGRLR